PELAETRQTRPVSTAMEPSTSRSNLSLPWHASPVQTFRQARDERDGSALSDAAHEVIDSWLGVRLLEPTNALGGFIDSAKMAAQAQLQTQRRHSAIFPQRCFSPR